MEVSRDYQLLQQEPLVKAISPRGGFHIPIEALENDLDLFQWSTRNYHWNVIKDGYANLVVAASIELVLLIRSDTGVLQERTFVGSCNFDIKSIAPNPDWNATAKSMCIKNAASEAGKRLGRGLNSEVIPVKDDSVKPSSAKLNPDTNIIKQYLKAVAEKDKAMIDMLSNIYELKTE
jgi:hypothetical protein